MFTVINFADKAVIGIAAVPMMHELERGHAGLGWPLQFLPAVRGLVGRDRLSGQSQRASAIVGDI